MSPLAFAFALSPEIIERDEAFRALAGAGYSHRRIGGLVLSGCHSSTVCRALHRLPPPAEATLTRKERRALAKSYKHAQDLPPDEKAAALAWLAAQQ